MVSILNCKEKTLTRNSCSSSYLYFDLCEKKKSKHFSVFGRFYHHMFYAEVNVLYLELTIIICNVNCKVACT